MASAKTTTSPEGGTVLTRTLTLADGHHMRVRERLEGEDRIYVAGEKLDEIRIVASDATVEEVLATLRTNHCPIIRRYGRTGTIIRARLAGHLDDDGRAKIIAAVKSHGGHVKASTFYFNTQRSTLNSYGILPSCVEQDEAI